MNKAERLLWLVDKWFHESNQMDVFIDDMYPYGNPKICDIFEDCKCESSLPGNCYIVVEIYKGTYYHDILDDFRQFCEPDVECETDEGAKRLFYEVENN